MSQSQCAASSRYVELGTAQSKLVFSIPELLRHHDGQDGHQAGENRFSNYRINFVRLLESIYRRNKIGFLKKIDMITTNFLNLNYCVF